MVSVSKIPKYLYVSYSPSALIFFKFGNSIPSVICRLPLFIISMAHIFNAKFHPYIFTVYPHCLY